MVKQSALPLARSGTPGSCFFGLSSNQACFAFEQQGQRSRIHSPAGHTSGHCGMKNYVCMSETREPEHMKSHFVNCRICTFCACLLRHETGAIRVGKARGATPLREISAPPPSSTKLSFVFFLSNRTARPGPSVYQSLTALIFLNCQRTTSWRQPYGNGLHQRTGAVSKPEVDQVGDRDRVLAACAFAFQSCMAHSSTTQNNANSCPSAETLVFFGRIYHLSMLHRIQALQDPNDVFRIVCKCLSSQRLGLSPCCSSGCPLSSIGSILCKNMCAKTLYDNRTFGNRPIIAHQFCSRMFGQHTEKKSLPPCGKNIAFLCKHGYEDPVLHSQEFKSWRSQRRAQVVRQTKSWKECSQIPRNATAAPPVDDSADMLSNSFSGLVIMPVRPAILEDNLVTMQKLEMAIQA